MYYGRQAPCMKCTEHRPGCHGRCEKYKEFIATVEASKAKEKDDTPADVFIRLQKLRWKKDAGGVEYEK